MGGFRLLPEAEAELDEIWLYIAQHPHLGRRRDSDLRPGLRSFAAGEYVIIYRIDGEDVVILHVMRGSRDIGALL
jgi:toxin ParE1/3/4